MTQTHYTNKLFNDFAQSHVSIGIFRYTLSPFAQLRNSFFEVIANPFGSQLGTVKILSQIDLAVLGPVLF